MVTRALAAAGERVIAQGGAASFADAAPSSLLDSLQDAVLSRLRAQPLPERAAPVGVQPQRLLSSLRAAFLVEVEHEHAGLRTSEVVQVMRAFEDVGRAVSGATPATPYASLEGEASGALVEVAHDMRSPLASILFLVETLRSGHSGPMTAVQERQLGLVYGAALGLSSLASDLIEFARNGDRLVDVRSTPFSVREIFGAIHDIVLPIAEEKGLSLRLKPPEADWRKGSPAALHRVLLNLTTNALKFTSHGFVEVSARQLSPSRVEFAVSDTGRGIPEEVLATLGGPPCHGDEGGRCTFSSAGLGLSICRKLVHRMGGELRAETTAGKGSSLLFTLDLPLAVRF